MDKNNLGVMVAEQSKPIPSEKTLRDEFAMAALTGVAASDVRDSAENFAKVAYALADAMMEARKRLRDQTEEAGWLIENYDSKHNIYRAEWLTAGIYTHADDRDHWTKDASKALRFARKADADAVIAELGWTEARATEHRWLGQ